MSETKPERQSDENNQPSKWAIQKSAKIWCKPSCSNKVMDSVLATEFAKELDSIKSQTDELARALEVSKSAIENCDCCCSKAILAATEALSNYRKGE